VRAGTTSFLLARTILSLKEQYQASSPNFSVSRFSLSLLPRCSSTANPRLGACYFLLEMLASRALELNVPLCFPIMKTVSPMLQVYSLAMPLHELLLFSFPPNHSIHYLTNCKSLITATPQWDQDTTCASSCKRRLSLHTILSIKSQTSLTTEQ
jgi:hypothetical protein